MKNAFEEARFEIVYLNGDVIVTSGGGADAGASTGDIEGESPEMP